MAQDNDDWLKAKAPVSSFLKCAAKNAGRTRTTKTAAMVHMDLVVPRNTNMAPIFGSHGHPVMSHIDIEHHSLCTGRGTGDKKVALGESAPITFDCVRIDLRIDGMHERVLTRERVILNETFFLRGDHHAQGSSAIGAE